MPASRLPRSPARAPKKGLIYSHNWLKTLGILKRPPRRRRLWPQIQPPPASLCGASASIGTCRPIAEPPGRQTPHQAKLKNHINVSRKLAPLLSGSHFQENRGPRVAGQPVELSSGGYSFRHAMEASLFVRVSVHRHSHGVQASLSAQRSGETMELLGMGGKRHPAQQRTPAGGFFLYPA